MQILNSANKTLKKIYMYFFIYPILKFFNAIIPRLFDYWWLDTRFLFVEGIYNLLYYLTPEVFSPKVVCWIKLPNMYT